MLVTLEKFDIEKGTTYKREFQLDTNCIVLEKDYCCIAIIHGDFDKMDILCRDKDNADFISVRISYDIAHDFTTYHFDTIKYFDNNEIKVLLRSGDTL